MFGKPQWFVEKKNGWGLSPATWQGWFYATAAGATIVIPCLLLLTAGRIPESLIWTAVAIAGLTWDVRQVLAQMRKPAGDEVFVINDETDISSVATRNYDLHLRN